MFTPTAYNTTGFPMDENYSKISPNGWSIGFPEADNYQTSPIDGTTINYSKATKLFEVRSQ